MEIIKEKINRERLKEQEKFYQTLTKIAVDLEKEIVCFGCELHVDCASMLVEQGSNLKNVWGANIKFDIEAKDMIEFYSLINIRPSDNNFSMEITLPEIKSKLQDIVFKFID